MYLSVELQTGGHMTQRPHWLGIVGL